MIQLDIKRTPELLKAVEKEVEKFIDKPYEKNMVELLKSMTDFMDRFALLSLWPFCFDLLSLIFFFLSWVPHSFSSFIPLTKNTKEGKDSVFCSELVAYVYQGIGLLKTPDEGGLIANEYSPCDFGSERNRLHLTSGVLEKEVMFGFPPHVVIPPVIDLVTEKGSAGTATGSSSKKA